MNDIKTVELCCGIGGLRKGLEEASPRYKIIWANDWVHGSQRYDEQTKRWKGSKNLSGQIYTKHWNDGTYHDGNIFEIQADAIPDCDLIVGGFPCQPFSMAGERKGFADFRGTLFFEIARIIEAKRPKVFLLENVKGLLSAQNGFCFLAILDRLDELGYCIEWKIIDTANWLPQTRERIFIVGHLRERSPSPILPFAKCCEALAEFGVKEAGVPQQTVGTVTATMHKLTRGMPLILQARNQSNELRIYEHACPTLTARMGTGGGNVPLVAACLTPNRLEKRQNGRRFKEPGEEMFTLTAQDIHGLYIDGNIRTLTERECERLQGFPDDWTLGVSRQQRYHTLGNAVTVPVIKYLGQLLLEAF